MASLTDIHQGTVVTWQRSRWLVQHHGCATGMGRNCRHADHAPIAALRLDPKTDEPASTLTTCLPSDEVQLT